MLSRNISSRYPAHARYISLSAFGYQRASICRIEALSGSTCDYPLTNEWQRSVDYGRGSFRGILKDDGSRGVQTEQRLPSVEGRGCPFEGPEVVGSSLLGTSTVITSITPRGWFMPYRAPASDGR